MRDAGLLAGKRRIRGSIEPPEMRREEPAPSRYWRKLNSARAILISSGNPTYKVGGEFIFGGEELG